MKGSPTTHFHKKEVNLYIPRFLFQFLGTANEIQVNQLSNDLSPGFCLINQVNNYIVNHIHAWNVVHNAVAEVDIAFYYRGGQKSSAGQWALVFKLVADALTADTAPASVAHIPNHANVMVPFATVHSVRIPLLVVSEDTNATNFPAFLSKNRLQFQSYFNLTIFVSIFVLFKEPG